MKKTSSTSARWIGIAVLLLIISLGELVALVLEYQNNAYLRQYVSDNLATTFGAAVGLVAVALGAGYLVSKRLTVRVPGPRIPTFARIGSFVSRRHRLIIVFWILLLVASFPLSQNLSKVITSSTSGGQSSTSQSALAQTLMAQEFPHPRSNASAIILLQGTNVMDNATRKFILDLENRLLVPGVLDSVENVTTVYSLERTILTQGIQQISPAIYNLQSTTLGLNSLLYLVPFGYEQAWIQTNNTALIIYGIPVYFLAQWTSNGGNNNAANTTTTIHIDAIIASGALNSTAVSLLKFYYSKYYTSWIDASNVSNSTTRTLIAIKNAVGNTTASLPPQAQIEVLGIWQSFSLNNWNNTGSLNAYTQSAIEPVLGQQFSNTPFQQLYSRYFFYWASAWNASFTGPSQSPQTRLATILTSSFISSAAALALPLPMGQLIAGLILKISVTFTLTTATNSTLIHSLAIAQARQGTLTTSFLEEAYSLGPSPSYAAAQKLASQTLLAYTLSSYPIQIPSAILQNFISTNKNAMIVLVDFSKSPGSFGSAETDPILKNVVTIRNIISQLLANDGGPSQTYVTGDLAITADSSLGSAADLSRIEPVTVAAILILVGLFFFAVVTPLVPLATIGMALLIVEGGLYLVGRFVIPIQDTATTFLFTVMLGVGTDYAIFLMARYREERVEGRDKRQAVHTSVTWSGESIATSATTVIIAFGAMTISTFTLLRSIGTSLAFGVLIALLVSLTLIPSLVLMTGDRVFWPTSGKRFEKYAARAQKRRSERPGYFRRAASFSVKRPVLVLGLALLVSLPAIYITLTGSTTYDFTAGLTQAESVHGITALEESFGAGQIGPTQVLVQFPATILLNGNLTARAQADLGYLSQNITTLSNVREVTGPTRPDGTPVDATNMTRLTQEQKLAILDSIGKDNRTAMLTVLFVEEPFTPNSLNTVTQIRNLSVRLQTGDTSLSQDTILVGGASASTLDFANETVNQFNTMRVITVAAIFLVLLVVLGSYPLAFTGILSIGLSITWAYAATLLFFNDVLQSGVLFIIPLVLFLLLYGIGMDYNIFILTRIREEAQKGKETHQAVIDAVDRTGGIITALALILAGALGSLLLSSNRLLQGFGFAIGLAVILDAMVVRTYIVPAGMSLLGRRAWWGPNRLRRVRFDKNESSTGTSQETGKVS